MNRFVETVPDRARTAIYLGAFLVVVEIVVSLLAAGLFIGLAVYSEGPSVLVRDVTALLKLVAGFQLIVVEYEALRFVFAPYARMPNAIAVPLVTTTLYVASGLGLWRFLGRFDVQSTRGVDAWLTNYQP